MESRTTAFSSHTSNDGQASTSNTHTHDETDSHAEWHRRRHEHAVSTARPGEDDDLPIALEDHEEHHEDEVSALWARAVIINDWTVIGGGAIGGSYVVWNCTIQTLDASQPALC